MQVRAGTGGDEACLFAWDLFRMYERYAAVQRWKFEVGRGGGWRRGWQGWWAGTATAARQAGTGCAVPAG